jgi:nucleotide-binding universal stress UspA family protein
MYKKILVPLDGSTNAEIVIPYVIAMGANLGVEIVLTSVCDPNIAELEQLHKAYLERKLEQIRLQLQNYGSKKDARVSFKVLTGSPSDEIVSYAGEIKADLIVIASRGLSGQVPPLLGNISTKVLWSTEKPVLLIKAAAPEAAIENNKLLKRILLPLDSSKTGEATIEHARFIAGGFGSEIVLFQALEPVKPIIGFETMTSFAVPDNEEVEKAAVDYLTGIQNRLKKAGLEASAETVWGSAAECILDYAEANEIDLIALSARGKSNISRWVFGSVTEKVLHAGTTPLLIAR